MQPLTNVNLTGRGGRQAGRGSRQASRVAGRQGGRGHEKAQCVRSTLCAFVRPASLLACLPACLPACPPCLAACPARQGRALLLDKHFFSRAITPRYMDESPPSIIDNLVRFDCSIIYHPLNYYPQGFYIVGKQRTYVRCIACPML